MTVTEGVVAGPADSPRVVVKVPDGAGGAGRMLAWLRSLPRVVHQGDEWQVIDAGPGVVAEFERMGVRLVSSEGGIDVRAAFRPLVVRHPLREDVVLVRPRLAGMHETADILGPTAMVETGAGGAFLLPYREVGRVEELVDLDPGVMRRTWPPCLPAVTRRAVARLAAAQDLADPADADAYSSVADAVGDIPDWFGLELDPYQRAGALAAVAGQSAVCDPPGLGKTRTLLAALATYGARRSVIVTPPFPVVTHWERETAASRIAEHCGPGGAVVTLQAGKKLPDLPPSGVAIVPDTLLAARPAVARMLADWRPDGFAIDEVHRAKSWWAKRSQAVRRMADACDGIRIAASGTPMLANAHEMASMLSITGHLDSVFGGLAAFERRFCVQNKFGAWSSRRRALPELKTLLDERVWVRRRKLMATAKRRYVEFIDPDMSVWRAANRDVHATIDRFLAAFELSTGRPPEDGEIVDWARGEMGLVTQMRRAAGLAKVAGIAEKAAGWVEGYTHFAADGSTVYERPLIIWTWHQDVSEALARAVPERIGAAGVIIGSTKAADRSRLVDAFQAGAIPVLVCSIPTVGVGVTLTRGSDAWFAETDWTPALVSQAEDRQWRRGQSRDVRVTTFVAPGTLDERIQNTLARKAADLEQVLTGGDNQVAVLDRSSDAEQQQILLDLVRDRIASRTGGRRRAAA